MWNQSTAARSKLCQQWCDNKPHVVLDGVTVGNTTANQPIVRIGEKYIVVESGSFIVRNSLFQDTSDFQFYYVKNIKRYNCTFTNPVKFVTDPSMSLIRMSNCHTTATSFTSRTADSFVMETSFLLMVIGVSS